MESPLHPPPLTAAERRVRKLEADLARVKLQLRDATEAQVRSEERLRLVLDSVHDYAIITLDKQGIIANWSAGAYDIFGWVPDEAIGEPADIIFTPEDRATGVPQQELRDALQYGRASDDRWHVRKDGSRVFVSGVMEALKRGDQHVGYAKVARDVTQRQQSEMAARVRAEQERVRLLRQLVTAQEEERRRISRELHDQLGQEVTMLGLKLGMLKDAPEISAGTREELLRLEALASQIDNDVEFLVWELRPTGLDDLGLAEALADHVQGWSRYFGVRVDLQSRLKGRLREDLETILYRIVQEALNNVAKHARAHRVTVVLEQANGHVSLVVEDDGLGFDHTKRPKGKSLGLTSMRERAALVGGSTTVEPADGGGTRVSVVVPLGLPA